MHDFIAKKRLKLPVLYGKFDQNVHFFSVLWIFLLKFIKFLQDYSLFFERHALNSTYPGYRAPPGTQHYGYQYPQYPQHPQYHQ